MNRFEADQRRPIPADELPEFFRFLANVKRGVIHVGANYGQERDLYAKFDLPVIWFEPIPQVFRALKAKLAGYPKQRAYRRLLTDKDNVEVTFFLTNVGGKMSSMLPRTGAASVWPNVKDIGQITVRSITLATVMARKGIDPAGYDALVIDTQGSELLVLKGAGDLLRGFDYIMTEATDFETYAGGCLIGDLDEYLGRYGFRQTSCVSIGHKHGVGSLFNVLYEVIEDRR